MATILLSPRVSRRVALVLGPRHNDAGVRLAQARRALDPEHAAEWSRRLVLAKLRRQLALLERALPARPDRRKPLVDATRGLDGVIETLRDALKPSVDSICGSRARAHGSTSRASHHCFRTAFSSQGAIADHLAIRSMPPCHSDIRCFTSRRSGPCMLPAWTPSSFYHRPAFGRESLACDLVRASSSRRRRMGMGHVPHSRIARRELLQR